MTWLNWVVPGLIAFVLSMVAGGIRELIKLWNASSLQAQEMKSTKEIHAQDLKSVKEDVYDEKRRNDAQDIRLGTQDQTLARIDENVKFIKERLDNRIQ